MQKKCIQSPLEPEIAQYYCQIIIIGKKILEILLKMVVNNIYLILHGFRCDWKYNKNNEIKNGNKNKWAENEAEEEIQIYMVKKNLKKKKKKLEFKKEEEKQF